MAAELHRTGGTETPSYLIPGAAPYGRIGWQLMVSGRPPDANRIGNGTIVTLLRLGLLQRSSDESRVTFTDYGIKTWNRFRERGGQFPEDLVDTFP